jgi:hypothetical protein
MEMPLDLAGVEVQKRTRSSCDLQGRATMPLPPAGVKLSAADVEPQSAVEPQAVDPAIELWVSSFVPIDIYDSYSHSDHEQLNPLYAACNKGCLIRASTCIIAKPNIQYLNIHIR